MEKRPSRITNQTFWSALNKALPILLLGVASQAQQLSVEEYRKNWNGANELILSDKSSYNIFVEDKKVRVLRDDHYESVILSESGIVNNKESFTYSELVKLQEYEAFSIIPDGSRERKVKVTQTSEKLARENSIFHNDVKERQLNFMNLQTGARKVYDVKREFLDPYLLHSFVFGSGLPMLNSTLEVRTDKDINIGYKIFNDAAHNIAFTKTEKKGKTVYTWTMKDIKGYKGESNDPGFRYSIPHIYVYIKDFSDGDQRVNVLDDTNRLYEYYRGFLKNVNKTENPELKAFSKELTAGEANDSEKIKRIFYWVKDNVKYIAFENGYEGFIPRESALVYERKFGDCKDMATLITNMADYAGIKDVHVCWIGTREIPYTYSELSTPAVDNHMIAVYLDQGKPVFLDATDRNTRFGIPTAFIQGKEALIGLGDSYKIVTVPVVTPAENFSTERLTLNLDGEKLTGTGTMDRNGYARSHVLMQLGDASNRTRFEMIKSLVSKGSNKFNLKDFKESNVEDRDLPYRISYGFDLDNYAVKVDHETFVGLAMDKPFETMLIEADRKIPFELEYLTQLDIVYDLMLPKGATVKYLPKDFQLDNELMSAAFDYTATAGKVSLQMRLTTKKLLLQPTDFALWNKTIEQLKANYAETLILTDK